MLIRVNEDRRRIFVKSVTAKQLAAAPRTQHPEQITLKEEDRIAGYFAGGHMYATRSRQEPIV
jgi:photosynthetic reaction center H subunit